jgi:hypothetical protein
MTEAEKKHFAIALRAMIAATAGTYCVPDDVVAAYWRALKNYPLGKVTGALDTLASTAEGHQAPAAVVRAVTGKKRDSAKEDFEMLMTLIKRHGFAEARNRVDQNSKAWKAVLAVGGLQALNTGQYENVRSAFFEAYDKA